MIRECWNWDITQSRRYVAYTPGNKEKECILYWPCWDQNTKPRPKCNKRCSHLLMQNNGYFMKIDNNSSILAGNLRNYFLRTQTPYRSEIKYCTVLIVILHPICSLSWLQTAGISSWCILGINEINHTCFSFNYCNAWDVRGFNSSQLFCLCSQKYKYRFNFQRIHSVLSFLWFFFLKFWASLFYIM